MSGTKKERIKMEIMEIKHKIFELEKQLKEADANSLFSLGAGTAINTILKNINKYRNMLYTRQNKLSQM